MNRDEFRDWKKEDVDITIDKVLGTTGKALIVQVDGSQYFVGNSIVGNLEELEDQLHYDLDERDEDITLTVPRWCAHENGWLDDEE